jgi:hypothetical protein
MRELAGDETDPLAARVALRAGKNVGDSIPLRGPVLSNSNRLVTEKVVRRLINNLNIRISQD